MVYDPLASLGGRIQYLSLINIRKFEKCNVLLHVIMSRIFACLIYENIKKCFYFEMYVLPKSRKEVSPVEQYTTNYEYLAYF